MDKESGDNSRLHVLFNEDGVLGVGALGGKGVFLGGEPNNSVTSRSCLEERFPRSVFGAGDFGVAVLWTLYSAFSSCMESAIVSALLLEEERYNQRFMLLKENAIISALPPRENAIVSAVLLGG